MLFQKCHNQHLKFLITDFDWHFVARKRSAGSHPWLLHEGSCPSLCYFIFKDNYWFTKYFIKLVFNLWLPNGIFFVMLKKNPTVCNNWHWELTHNVNYFSWYSSFLNFSTAMFSCSVQVLKLAVCKSALATSCYKCIPPVSLQICGFHSAGRGYEPSFKIHGPNLRKSKKHKNPLYRKERASKVSWFSFFFLTHKRLKL